MAEDKESQSLDTGTSDKDIEPGTYTNPVDEINPANDDRTIDIGEQGQFAPGGRYNELNVTSADRVDLDQQVNDALRDEEK